MALTHFVIFTVIAAAYAEIATIRPCEGVPENMCTINEVRITPCHKMRDNSCRLARGNASISFDFTPNFVTSKLKTNVYYLGKAFEQMGTDDACALSACPTVPGTSQTLEYTLHIGKRLPSGLFAFDWKVWDDDNASTNVCCFKTSVKLTKPKKTDV